jgi:hypothetical protein
VRPSFLLATATLIGLLGTAGGASARGAEPPRQPPPARRNADLAALLDQVDKADLKELIQRLERSRRLDARGQELLRQQAQAKFIIARAEDRCGELLMIEEVNRCNNESKKPEFKKQLAQVQGAKTKAEMEAAFGALLRRYNISRDVLEQTDELRKSEEAAKGARQELEEIEAELVRHEHADNDLDLQYRAGAGSNASNNMDASKLLEALRRKRTLGSTNATAAAGPASSSTRDTSELIKTFLKD